MSLALNWALNLCTLHMFEGNFLLESNEVSVLAKTAANPAKHTVSGRLFKIEP